MAVLAKMDEVGGKAGWMAAMIVAFIWHWPIGLAILLFLVFSGRFRAWRNGRAPGRWYPAGGMDLQSRAGGQAWTWNWGGGSASAARPSGNRAFDEYRTETLRRLEEEQREFVEYLERLRRARDKAEFDQFMAERRNRPPAPTVDQTVTDV